MPVVAAALQDAAGKWLMHRRPPGSYHAGLWEFPGGKVENGENPPFALAREIAEETSIVLDPADLQPAGFAWQGAENGRPAIVIMLYTTSHWRGEPEALEGGELAWFDAGEIHHLPKPPLDLALAQQLLG